MKNSKKKIVIASIALIAMFGTTAGAFAYWIHGVNAASVDSPLDIQIGKGEVIDTTLSLASMLSNQGANELIPTHITPKAGQVTSVTQTGTIVWTADEAANLFTGTTGTLSVALTSVYVSGDATKADLLGSNLGIDTSGAAVPLFTVELVAPNPATLTLQSTVDNTPTPVALELLFKMSEPSTKAVYDSVATKNLTFAVTLSVAVNA